MGLSAMAESCGVPYDAPPWTAEWYFRPETLDAANAAVVSYHHRLPLTRAFGSGALSSSGGQRFPVKGKSITARHTPSLCTAWRVRDVAAHVALAPQSRRGGPSRSQRAPSKGTARH